MQTAHVARALLATLFLVTSAAVAARAQGRSGLDPMEAYRTLMLRRMEESQRSVNEILRRRFEEGRERRRFPSDADKSRESAKAGVVRALTPEERKALARNERGLEYFSKNEYERALKEYEEAVSLYPTLAAAHNNMGSAYFALARYEESARCFREATRIDPTYAQAHFNLALASIKLGRERDANDSLLAATRAYVAEGDAYLDAGLLKEAEESYRALLQIDPDYTVAHQRLGLVHNAARRFDEAAASFKRALAKNPDEPSALEGIAETYLGTRDYTRAADAATHAARLRPDSPAAHYLAGLAHASLGQRALALADLARLQQLHADAPAKLLSDFIEKKAPEKK
jgi:tetratricopeptide (TPR) repeat protein